MKVLLIRHPQIFQSMNSSHGPRIGLPLGILYIASYLRKSFPETSIRVLDALVEFPLDVDNPRLDENGFIHFGMTYEDISKAAESYQPDIIGISNQYTDFLDQAVKTAEAVKKTNPRSPVVIGGNPSTVNPRKILENRAIDIAVSGEGELTMAELIQWRSGRKELSEIPGISYRDTSGNVVTNEPRPPIDDLDMLPLPAYELIDMQKYFQMERMGFTSRYKFEYPGAEKAVSLITSRGCPFDCFFCSIKLHMGKKYRSHSAEYIIRHIEYLKDTYDIKHIHFEDDNLTLNKVHFNKILDGMSLSNHLTWDTPNGIRIDTLNHDLIKKMVNTGCVYIIVGIESGCQEVIDRLVKKRLDLKVAEENIRIAFQEGLDTHAFYVIGFPGETRKQIKTTIDYAISLKKRFNVVPHVGIANPIEGTEMFEKARAEGWLVDNQEDGIRFHFGVERRFKRKSIRTPEFDIQYLNKLMATFRKKVMILSARQAFLFLFSHPSAAVHVTRYLLDDLTKKRATITEALQQLFFKKLFYPGYLIRFLEKRRA